MKFNSENNTIVLFFLIGFSLPFKDQFSTAVIISALIYFLIELKINKKDSLRFNKIPKYFFVPLLLFIPRIYGLINGNIDVATNELIRSAPYLIFPVIFLLQKKKKLCIEKYFFYGLLSGLILFMIVCESVIVYKMIKFKEPLEYFFRWRHMNFNFTKPFDAHPAYIGILIVWVLTQSLFKNYFSKNLKFTLLFVLCFFLIQLLARNSFIVAIFVILCFIAVNKLYKLLFGFLVFLSITMAIVLTHPDQYNYLRKKLIYSLNFSNEKSKDKRFTRLRASYIVFQKSPIFGVGPENDNVLRKIEYKLLEDEVAYKKNYNSHNQFFEYLVTSGIIGLICFLLVFYYLFSFLIKNKEYSYIILLLAFMIACLTESVLERTLGIKYFSILISLILYKTLSATEIRQKTEKD